MTECRNGARPAVRATLALAAVLACQYASAQAPGVKISGGVSYGVGIRAQDPNPDLLFVNNAPAAGLASTNTAGRNQDDGNMNYRKGDVFSNVVKGFLDLQPNSGRFDGLVRLQGWHDFELADGTTPWGHTANEFRTDIPLSDAGARSRGKFSNAVVSDAWVRGRFDPGLPVTVTLGQQVIGWRGRGLVPGMMAGIDPADFIARSRPGAFAEEGTIPIPALRATTKAGGVDLDGFLQFGFRANQTPLCGTFFAAADRTLDGCDKTMVNAGAGTRTDRELLAAGRFVRLGSVIEAGDSGQFGLSARWGDARAGTRFGLSYARYHSRTGYTNMVKSQIPGANPFAANDPRNPQTQVVYPEGIQALALEFERNAGPVGTVYGSVGYSPNTPLSYAAGEVFQAFVAPVASASLFRAQERATAPGGIFEGWDRRQVSQWQVGVIKPLRQVAGAATMTLRAEINARVVHDLPDPTVLRYGRPEVYGVGPINGACGAGASAVTCTNDGYLSRSAWGYTLQAIATYPKVVADVDLRPRVSFAHNVHGWSYDGLIREGRKTMVLGLDAIRGKTTFGVSLVRHTGGTYDNTTDRDYLSASLATRF